MRLFALCGMLALATPGLAQQTQQKKNDETRYTIGYSYQRGTLRSPLSLAQGHEASGGIGMLFVEARGAHSRVYGETSALGGFSGLQSHSVEAQASVVRLFGLTLDGGIEINYFEQPIAVFEHDRTELRGNHKQGFGLGSIMTGIGAYRETYIRGGIVGGIGYIENSLDLYVNGDAVRRNRSEISSGIPHIYGVRVQGGTSLHGVRLHASLTRLFVDGVPSYLLDHQEVITAAVSYQTPWHVGAFARVQASTGNPSILFLNDTFTFGATLHWPR